MKHIGSTSLPVDTPDFALATGINEKISVLLIMPDAEGRLLKHDIAMVTGLNPDLVILLKNIKLPFTRTVGVLFDVNDPALDR